MGRSLKKGPYIDPKLEKKIENLSSSDKKQVIKTWSRKIHSCKLSYIQWKLERWKITWSRVRQMEEWN